MKKSKLFLSIVSFCFALSVLCFGVYAAGQVDYTINGNITYNVSDCYVKVETKVYSVPSLQDLGDLYEICDELGESTYSSLGSSKTLTYNSLVLTQKYTSESYDSRYDGNGGEYTDSADISNLRFVTTQGSEAYAYVFVINVENLSGDINVWAVVDEVTVPKNVIWSSNFYQLEIGTKKNAPTNKNIVIAMGLDNPTTKIELPEGEDPEDNFTFELYMGSGEYVDSELNLSKFDATKFESGYAQKHSSNTTGVVSVPNGKTFESLPYPGGQGFRSSNIYCIITPDSVTTISGHSFGLCYDLRKLSLSNEVTIIGNNCFNTAKSLTIVRLPNKLETIESFAFDGGCHSLVSIDIPASIKSIGNRGITNCSHLKSIIVRATTPPSGAPFEDTNNCPIYVPSASVDAYKSAWSTYASRIQAIPA